MRDDPGLDLDKLAASVKVRYGILPRAITYLPIGYDLSAAVYEVIASDGAAYFLKIRSGPFDPVGLKVARTLTELGIPHILAPVRTIEGEFWGELEKLDGRIAILYPFIHGESAVTRGLTDEQWRAFGRTLRAVHDSGPAEHFAGRLRAEAFDLSSAALLRRVMAGLDEQPVDSAAADHFATFLNDRREQIDGLLDRAEALGRSLQGKRFEQVLCHGDIHAANILVGEDGAIWMVDWDAPLIAPRERDLLFVVGSQIARAVTVDEEDCFFDGYGPAEIDVEALIYYRYERIIEDLGEIGKSVLENPERSEAARRAEVELAIGFFTPGADIDHAEHVPRTRWP